MIKYEAIKPKVYIATTVVSYLVARPSNDVTLAERQRATRALWENYSDTFEFIVSDIVITEIRQGNKHIVDETKRQHIDQVCQVAGYQPIILCTPAELIEGIQMKEEQHPPMDPVLEECYRMKAEFNARFKTMQELVDYLKAENIKNKAEGWKYISPPPTKRHNQT